MNLKIETLANSHHKKDFNCGYDLLDSYIQRQAKQDAKRELAACFVLTNESQVVLGYYTLSASSIPREDLPESTIQKLPSSYTALPVVLLGRLAVDTRHKGLHYGANLLLDALERCYTSSQSMGVLAVVVDPIDQKAEEFYKKYGFIILPGTGKMFLPMQTIKDLFR